MKNPAFRCGVFLFAREYWQTTLAPLVLLLVVHATWLTKIKHAGYTTVGTAVYCIPYPYAPALGLGLCMWWLTLRALKGSGNLWICACLTLVLTYTIFVTHQLQALFMVGFAFSLLLFFPSGASARAKLVLGSSLILGLLLTQWWWYMDPIAYILNPQVQAGHSGKRHLDFSFENWSTISRMVRAIGLASFGVLGFWSFREAKVRWELLLPFVVVFSGFLYLVVVGSWVDIRVMPFVVFLLQLGVVSFLLERHDNKFGKLIK